METTTMRQRVPGSAPGFFFHLFSFITGKKNEALYPRLLRYLDEAHRDGAIGDGRYAVALGKAAKLNRFLTIIGQRSMPAREFTTELVMEYRQFLYDEYKYVPLYPDLYPRGSGYHWPKKRIRRSPFRKLSMEKRRMIMHTMYDAPIFLRAEELQVVMSTDVPSELQWAKDMFVLNCAIGCRIGDLLRLSMDKVAVSEEGIPYVHYMPSKTARLQTINSEVMTPLIEPALEIIKRTGLHFTDHNHHYGLQRYNKALRRLLQVCGITRRVSIFCPETGDNTYRPICEIATSKLARKTHIDMLNKVQINYYAAGLHRAGSDAVFRYTGLELKDRYELMKAAFQ